MAPSQNACGPYPVSPTAPCALNPALHTATVTALPCNDVCCTGGAQGCVCVFVCKDVSACVEQPHQQCGTCSLQSEAARMVHASNLADDACASLHNEVTSYCQYGVAWHDLCRLNTNTTNRAVLCVCCAVLCCAVYVCRACYVCAVLLLPRCNRRCCECPGGHLQHASYAHWVRAAARAVLVGV